VRSERNAICLPSFDQRGDVSLPARVSWTSAPLATSITHTSLSYTLRFRSARETTYAICLPSGDQCGDDG
jgi:hypothetical protein